MREKLGYTKPLDMIKAGRPTFKIYETRNF